MLAEQRLKRRCRDRVHLWKSCGYQNKPPLSGNDRTRTARPRERRTPVNPARSFTLAGSSRSCAPLSWSPGSLAVVVQSDRDRHESGQNAAHSDDRARSAHCDHSSRRQEPTRRFGPGGEPDPRPVHIESATIAESRHHRMDTVSLSALVQRRARGADDCPLSSYCVETSSSLASCQAPNQRMGVSWLDNRDGPRL